MVVDVNQADWPNLAARFLDLTYEQAVDYAIRITAHAGENIRFVAIFMASELIGVAAIRMRLLPVINRGIAYVSAGPLVRLRGASFPADRYAIAATALRRQLVEKEGHFLYVRLPLVHDSTGTMLLEILRGGYRSTTRVRAYRTIAIDVTRDECTLQSCFAAKWRTDLKYAQKQGLLVEHGSSNELAQRFLEIFSDMTAAKSFDVRVDPKKLLAMPPAPLGVIILLASRNGRDAGAHVISLLGDTAVYLFGATNEIGRTSKAGYLLNWEAMRLVKQKGGSWYDLGGIDPDGNPGGYRFKRRMGGMDVTSPGPFEARPLGLVGYLGDWLLKIRDSFKAGQ